MVLSTPAPTSTAPAHPARRVIRTVLATLVPACAVVPLIVQALNVDPDKYPEVAGLLAALVVVAAAITRVLALPQVEGWLQKSISWLAANDVSSDEVANYIPKYAVAAIQVGRDVVAGPAATVPDGSPVAVTPIPSNGPQAA